MENQFQPPTKGLGDPFLSHNISQQARGFKWCWELKSIPVQGPQKPTALWWLNGQIISKKSM